MNCFLKMVCCVLLFVGCNTHDKHGATSQTDDIIGEECGLCADSSYYHYTRDTTKSNESNLKLGWVDTFSIGASKFRLYVDNSTDSVKDGGYRMDVWEKGKWVLNFTTDYLPLGFGFEDWDRDGFADFTAGYRKLGMVNLYQPKLGRFDSVCWYHHSTEPVLLDTCQAYLL